MVTRRVLLEVQNHLNTMDEYTLGCMLGRLSTSDVDILLRKQVLAALELRAMRGGVSEAGG